VSEHADVRAGRWYCAARGAREYDGEDCSEDSGMRVSRALLGMQEAVFPLLGAKSIARNVDRSEWVGSSAHATPHGYTRVPSSDAHTANGGGDVLPWASAAPR